MVFSSECYQEVGEMGVGGQAAQVVGPMRWMVRGPRKTQSRYISKCIGETHQTKAQARKIWGATTTRSI